jgi:Sensors of blue-light using FAD
MQLYRLVYYSKCNLISSGKPLAADLKQILATAVSKNTERGLTGGLIFNREYFAQVLEGGNAAVMQTFSRIHKDPRHKEVAITEMEPVAERLFGAWSMGFAGNSELFKKLCAEHGHAGKFNPKNMSGPDLTAFVLALVSHEENIASSQKIAAA